MQLCEQSMSKRRRKRTRHWLYPAKLAYLSSNAGFSNRSRTAMSNYHTACPLLSPRLIGSLSWRLVLGIMWWCATWLVLQFYDPSVSEWALSQRRAEYVEEKSTPWWHCFEHWIIRESLNLNLGTSIIIAYCLPNFYEQMVQQGMLSIKWMG